MKKLNVWKEFWSTIPLAIFILAGIAVSFLHHTNESPTPATEIGVVLLILLGASLELWIRNTLIEKANFPGLASTKGR